MAKNNNKSTKESLTVIGEYAVIGIAALSIMGGLIAIFTYDSLGWTLICAAVFFACLFILKARLKRYK